MDVKNSKILTTGEVGAWTFDNKSNEHVNKRAAANLLRFLRKNYDKIAEATSSED